MMKKIAEAYADEFFTDSFFEKGGELWDVDALNWFDEHHPDLTDEQRVEFSRHLDNIRSERSIPAYERLLATQGQNTRSFDPIKVELLERVKTCLKERNFAEVAEQSILKYTKDSGEDFYRATGWPLIYSGPGAGPYLHPLRMLEYAGLSPLKYEAPLLAAVTKRIFPYLRQDMFAILNGKEGPMKDRAAGKRLFQAINDGKRPLIKKYILKGEKDIQELLSLWAQSPNCHWSEILENEGMLKM